jgi:hypothetical protein
VVLRQPKPNLMQIIRAARTTGDLPDLLDRWNQHSDQGPKDRYHHQQLDQTKRRTRLNA